MVDPNHPRITRPNHVWCTDVTDIPLRRGFLYLVAVMDWASRTGLSWRLSNTLDARFCVEALHEASGCGDRSRTSASPCRSARPAPRPHSSLNDRTPDEAYTNDGADTSPGLRPVSCQPHVA